MGSTFKAMRRLGSLKDSASCSATQRRIASPPIKRAVIPIANKKKAARQPDRKEHSNERALNRGITRYVESSRFHCRPALMRVNEKPPTYKVVEHLLFEEIRPSGGCR